MSNYYGKYSTGEAEFYSLSVLPAEERWGVYTAAKCAGKFVKMASLIPEGGFTGWKLCSRRKKIVCSAFSSIASGVTKDDYEWIFKGRADIGRESGDTPAPKAHTPEYVYLLRLHDAGSIPAYDPDTFTEPGDAPESEKADFSVLIDILEDTDAEISFIFGIYLW